jgi:hypothetical protein
MSIQQHHGHKSNEMLTMLIYIVGLYVSFLVSGIFEEKIYKNKYDEGKLAFTHPALALMLISAMSLMISQGMLFTM